MGRLLLTKYVGDWHSDGAHLSLYRPMGGRHGAFLFLLLLWLSLLLCETVCSIRLLRLLSLLDGPTHVK